MSRYHRYCTHCGAGFDPTQWSRASFCHQCGKPLQATAKLSHEQDLEDGVYTPRRMEPSEKDTSKLGMAKRSYSFAQDNPVITAVMASGVGGVGLLLGPAIVAAGKMGVIAGGVTMATGLIIDSDTPFEHNRLLKAGAKMIGGSVIVTGAGYLITAAGGVSLATGVGIGAVQAGKGIHRVVKARQQAKALANSGETYPAQPHQEMEGNI